MTSGRATEAESARHVAIAAARTLADDKCDDVIVMDVRGLSQICDYIVVGSGSSDRQMRSASEDVAEVAESMDSPVFRRNEDARSTWIVVDLLDVVVHVFEPQTRAHYDLELLWGDAPRVAWQRERGGRDAGGEPGAGPDDADAGA